MNALPAGFSIQRVTLGCYCTVAVMGSAAMPLRVGDTWHCLAHRLVDVRVIAVGPGTLKDKDGLTRVDDANSYAAP